MTVLGAPTDVELRAELATANAERRAAIRDELERRERYRTSFRGHDPSLCEHPVRCAALR
jgi:hypothetical protein